MIPTSFKNGMGVKELFRAVIQVYEGTSKFSRHLHINYGHEIEDGISHIQKYLKDQGYSFRLLIDSSLEVTRNYGVSGYPTTFFIQPDGQYYGYMPGYMPEEDFLEVIDSCRNSN
jgi:thioredoxin-related protein